MADDIKFKITAEDDSGPGIQSAKKQMESLGGSATMSAKATAAAMRAVPAQFTDIITQLQGGSSAMTVFIQQGGQLKDMFGGAVPAAKALGGYIFDMISPLTVAAAAAASLFVAFEQGRSEATEFNKQLALTGGYAGLSASQLAVLAASIGKSNGTQHEAAEVLAALVATGKVAGSQFEVIAQGAIAMSSATGASIKDIVADFVALGEEPVKASVKLNAQHHYLTLAVYEQIVALEEQGKRTDAAALAQATYARAQKSSADQIVQNLGSLERGWKSVAEWARTAWNAMLDIGRTSTTAEKIAKVQKDLESAEKQYIPVGQEEGRKRAIDAYKAQLEGLREQLRNENRAAGARGTDAQSTAETIADREEKRSKKVAKPKAAPEYGIDAGLEKLKGQSDRIKQDLAASMSSIKASYDEGLISARRYLTAQFEAKQTALGDELAIAKQQEELAGGKRNIAAAERYANEEKRIQGEMMAGWLEYSNAVTTLAAKVQRAVTEYQRTLTAAYDTRQQGIDDQLQGASLGSVALGELQRMTELRREMDRRRAELTRDRQKGEDHGGISEETFSAELQALQGYYDSRVAQERGYNDRSAALRADWTVGSAKAIASYQESAQDVAGQTERMWTNAFSGMEDALVAFATTGKLSFKDLANSLIADMIRMDVRASISKVLSSNSGIFGAIASTLGVGGSAGAAGDTSGSSLYSLASAGVKLMANAKGGVYQSPSLHAYSNSIVDTPTRFAFAKGAGLMGEAGPEAIMPLSRGAGGRLGVALVGGAGAEAARPLVVNLQVEQHTSSQAKVETTQKQNSDGSFDVRVVLREVSSYLADDISSGYGPVHKAVRDRFGLNDSMG